MTEITGRLKKFRVNKYALQRKLTKDIVCLNLMKI